MRIIGNEIRFKDYGAQMLPRFAFEFNGARAIGVHARRKRLLGFALLKQQAGNLDYEDGETAARADKYMSASPWHTLDEAVGFGNLAELIMVLDN